MAKRYLISDTSLVNMQTKKKFRGQAAVETAIVLPLFLFTMLGMVQLALMNQARLMAKYAAYKAVRAGTLQRGNITKMENAALAVVTPMVGRPDSVGSVMKASNGSDYNDAYGAWQSATNKQDDLPIVEVHICAPYGVGQIAGDFDDPATGGTGSWKNFERTKLSAEVTFFYRMFIPFANQLIWYSSMGAQKAQEMQQNFKVVRLTGADDAEVDEDNRKRFGGDDYQSKIETLAEEGKFYIPLHASYSMRMQSNWENGVLPDDAEGCKTNFPKGVGESGGDYEDVPDGDTSGAD